MTEGTRSPGRRTTRLNPTAASLVPKRPATKNLLIEAGERLFGQHGFDGISLREIAIAAGQANTNVVQYHFKEKSGLVRAILEDRVYRFEGFRRELLQNLETGNDSRYARELLRILWLPSMTIRSAAGSHTFCRFLQQYMIQPHIAQHPLVTFYDAAESSTHAHELTALVEATRLLHDYYNNLPQPVMSRRWSALTMMFLATVVKHDNEQLLDGSDAPAQFDIEPILDMSIAALAAPSREKAFTASAADCGVTPAPGSPATIPRSARRR